MKLIAFAGGVEWLEVCHIFKRRCLSCVSLSLKASVGHQSPRVVPYPARSLCPGEPSLQSAAGSRRFSTCLFVRVPEETRLW